MELFLAVAALTRPAGQTKKGRDNRYAYVKPK